MDLDISISNKAKIKLTIEQIVDGFKTGTYPEHLSTIESENNPTIQTQDTRLVHYIENVIVIPSNIGEIESISTDYGLYIISCDFSNVKISFRSPTEILIYKTNFDRLYLSDLNCELIDITDCFVSGGIQFNNINVTQDIHFANVHYGNLTTLSLERCNSPSLFISEFGDLGAIVVEKSNLGNLSLSNSSINQITVTSSSLDEFGIVETSIQEAHFHQSKIEEFALFGTKIHGETIFSNLKIGNLSIGKGKFENLFLEQVQVAETFGLEDKELSIGEFTCRSSQLNVVRIEKAAVSTLKFIDTKFSDVLTVIEISFVQTILFSTCDAFKIVLANFQIQELKFNGGSYIQSLFILTMECPFISVYSTSITHLQINSSPISLRLTDSIVLNGVITGNDVNKFFINGSFKGNFQFRKLTIDLLEFKDLSMSADSAVNLINCSFRTARMSGCLVQGSLLFRGPFGSNEHKFEELIIINSTFQEIIFDNIPLSSLKNIRILDNTFTNLRQLNCVFPSNIQDYHKSDVKKNYKAYSNSFFQFAKSLEQQGLFDLASEFKKSAFKAKRNFHFSEIRSRNNTISNSLSWVVLKALDISGKNGESWPIAAAFILISNFFLYSIMQIHLFLTYPNELTFIDAYYNNFQLFFRMLNPAHDIDSFDLNLDGWIRFWDTLSKLLTSLGIFQILNHFKIIKKSPYSE